MAKTNTNIRGEQIETAVAGNGLEWVGDAVLGVDLKANDGLEIDTGELTVDYDDSTIGIVGDALAVKALGIDTAQLALDAVDGTIIEDDAVDSEHIAAGAIDLEHMSANSVDSNQYVDSSIDTAHIADLQVTNGKIAEDTIAESKLDIHAAPAGVDKVLGYTANGMEWVAKTDIDTFLELTDTPGAFEANKGVKVNAGANALIFYDIVDTDEKVKADSGADALYLNEIVDGDSIEITVGDNLAVKVDDSSIAIDAVNHYIEVKALGIATSMIALEAVDSGQIAAGAIDTAHIGASQVTLAKMADSSVDTAELVAESITEAKLDCSNAVGNGKYLSYDTGQFKWVDIDTDAVTETDFNFEDESAATDGSKVAFDLTNKPLVSSCQVFLNGLLQQAGVDKDYLLDAGATPPTVTFGVAPATSDLLLIFYVQDD